MVILWLYRYTRILRLISLILTLVILVYPDTLELYQSYSNPGYIGIPGYFRDISLILTLVILVYPDTLEISVLL